MCWRVALIAGWLCAAAQAQTPIETQMPTGIVHGGFVASSGTAAAGEIQVRDAANAVSFCFYDARTYVERAHERIAIADLSSGEPVEVLADRRAGSSNCYARIVYAGKQRPLAAIDPLLMRPLEAIPRGSLTFAGAVARVEGRDLTMRTRSGDVVLRLRGDTRFIDGGLRVERGALRVNAHIFVRAGRDVWGELEAYQVIWGTIVE